MKRISLILACFSCVFLFAEAFGFSIPRNIQSANSVLSIDADEGRTVVLFLSSECPCSDSYIPEIKRLSELYSGKGVRFVGVHSNHKESLADAQKYFTAKASGLEVIYDHEQLILEKFKALKAPHAFVVRNRDLRVIYHGGIGSTRNADSKMELYLQRALEQGDQPKPSYTKTLGCLIERKDS
jgi:thiol-disulfide isomerase/thioredoxin